MAEAAQLGARQLVLAGLGRLEPHQDVPPRNRVLLQAEIGQKKTMDHVPRLERNSNDLVHGNVNIVIGLKIVRRAELSVRPRIEDLPIELLGGDLQLKITGRGMALDF